MVTISWRLDSELSNNAQVVGWEMGVGESNHLLKVLLINLSEDSVDGEALCRKPYVVDHALETWRVVRRRRVWHQRVCTLEAETMFRSF